MKIYYLACFLFLYLLGPRFLSAEELELMKANFNAPTGVVYDKNGELYVSEWGSGKVDVIQEGKKKILLDNLPSPAGLAFDEAGNLYIAGYGDGNIYKWTGQGKPEVFAAGFKAPTGLLWDNGLFVANRNAGEIIKIDPSGNKKIISRGHQSPVGIARTSDGSLFVSCYGGSVDVIRPNGAKSSFTGVLSSPGMGIVPASANSVYVVDYMGGKIGLIGPDDKQNVIAENLSGPAALARTPDGNLIVGTWGDNSLHIIKNIKENKMKQSRFEKGLALLEKIDGIGGQAVVESLEDISSDFGRYLVEFPFGDIYSRPGLDLKSREIATVAALTALGNARPQLKVHIAAALNVGCTKEEIRETIIQMAVYAGFPAALNGLFAMREVFSEHN